MSKKGKYGKGNTIFQFPVGAKTIESYNKALRNTKAKINRVKKKYDIDLTNEIRMPSLESFSSRKELNKWIRKTESFRNRSNLNYQFVKNEYDVVASKKRINEIDRLNKIGQELAKKEIKKHENLPFYSGGKQQHTVGIQRPNKTGIYLPKDFDFNEVRHISVLDEIENNVTKRSKREHYNERKERMQNNFKKILALTFNSDANELIKEISQIPSDIFYKMYLEFDEFDFRYYDSKGNADDKAEENISKMMGYIEQYKRGDLNTDLYHENFE